MGSRALPSFTVRFDRALEPCWALIQYYMWPWYITKSYMSVCKTTNTRWHDLYYQSGTVYSSKRFNLSNWNKFPYSIMTICYKLGKACQQIINAISCKYWYTVKIRCFPLWQGMHSIILTQGSEFLFRVF